MSLLIDVPSDVILEVLSLWLESNDYRRLDSALCGHQSRRYYHHLLSKITYIDDTDSGFNKWLVSLNLEPRKLFLYNNMFCTADPVPDNSVYLNDK